MQKKCILAITTFNRVSRLGSLLKSFNESYDNSISWQIIIADDGSTDSTLKYIENLKIDTTKRVGYVDTKNFGFRGVEHVDDTM